MQLTFLGTSAGMPTKERNMSASILKLRNQKAWFLIDCAEGTQHALLHTHHSLKHLQAIFITHMHGDHCYGLPGLLASAYMCQRTEPLYLIGPKPLKAFLEAVMQTTYLNLDFDIHFCAVENNPLVFENKDFYVTRIPLKHRVPSFAYKFKERGIKHKLNLKKLKELGIPKGILWGKLQQGKEVVYNNKTIKAQEVLESTQQKRSVIIAGDNACPTLLQASAQACSLLVHEATYASDISSEVAQTYGHSTAQAVASFAQEVGVKNLLLTHFSPRYALDEKTKPNIKMLEKEAKAVFQKPLFLAKDLESFSLSKDEVLTRVE